MENNKKVAKVFGKVVKLPKNTDVVKFMENIKIPRNKHWYIITEKETDEHGNQVHLVKYNQEGIDSNSFVAQLKEFYVRNAKDDSVKKIFEAIQIIGNDKFSIIRNIPDIDITDTVTENEQKVEVKKTLVSKITADLIRLLRN